MCFAPQQRALFRHLNFQKWPEAEVSCSFWLPNVLCATTACNFSSFIWRAGSAPATLASLLFDPPEPQNIRKTKGLATFLPFRAPASSLFWLCPSVIFFTSDLLPSDFLHVQVSFWLCLFICPYCPKFSFQTSFGDWSGWMDVNDRYSTLRTTNPRFSCLLIANSTWSPQRR